MALSTKTQIEQKLKKEKRFDKIIGRKDVTEGLTEAQVNALIAQYLIDNPVGGSVAAFIPESTTRVSIPSGSAVGSLLSIGPAPTGKYYKIIQLNTNSIEQEGVEVVVNGSSLGLPAVGKLGGVLPASTCVVIGSNPISSTTASRGTSYTKIEPFLCTSFEITTSLATTNQIHFVYQLGSFA